MAERTQFITYLAYTAAIMGWVYPAVAHWVWGRGWLHYVRSVDLSHFLCHQFPVPFLASDQSLLRRTPHRSQLSEAMPEPTRAFI